MDASEHTRSIFRGRAYGLDIRVEREDDGSLSVYGAEAYTEHYELLARGSTDEIVRRFDVSGGLRRWLERLSGTGDVFGPERPRS